MQNTKNACLSTPVVAAALYSKVSARRQKCWSQLRAVAPIWGRWMADLRDEPFASTIRTHAVRV